MEDAFARSIGEVESHFDDGVFFFFSFSRAFGGVGGVGVKRSTESAKREEEEEG